MPFRIPNYLEFLLTTRWLLTLVAVLVLLASSALLARAIRRMPVGSDQRRRARRMARAVVLIALSSILLIIWAGRLKSVALVIGAFAVAIVIALREILQCLSGWGLKMAGHSFKIGDRIVVGDSSGEVVDYGLLTTTLLAREGLASGALISVPNAAYLTKPVRNDTRGLAFALRSLIVPVPKGSDWRAARGALLSAAESVYAPIAEDVRKGIADFESYRDCQLPSGTPAVLLKSIDDKGVNLELSMMLRLERAAETFDAVLTDYLGRLEALAPVTPAAPAETVAVSADLAAAPPAAVPPAPASAPAS